MSKNIEILSYLLYLIFRIILVCHLFFRFNNSFAHSFICSYCSRGYILSVRVSSCEFSQHHHDIRGCSVVFDLDGVERLIFYIHWLVRKNSTLAASLFEAKNALIKGDIVFETIEHVTDDEFTKMTISSGIKLLLRTQMKRFKKEEARVYI